jgi:hypothetical protein
MGGYVQQKYGWLCTVVRVWVAMNSSMGDYVRDHGWLCRRVGGCVGLWLAL